MSNTRNVTVKLRPSAVMESFPRSGEYIEVSAVEVVYVLTPRGWEWDCMHLEATPTNVIRQRRHGQFIPFWLNSVIDANTPKA